MNKTDNTEQCRVSLDEVTREGHATRNYAKVVSARVEELLDADSQDEDSITVLFESERFRRAFVTLCCGYISDDNFADLKRNPDVVHLIRSLISRRYDDKRDDVQLMACAYDLIIGVGDAYGVTLKARRAGAEVLEMAVNLISVTETVLTEYVENQS
jgi:hypothetical protein